MPTKHTTHKEGLSTGAIVGIGAGVVAAAAAAYFFFGPDGKKNRNKLKGWMIKMKGDIIERMERAHDLTEEAYRRIVDAVAQSYEKKGISREAVVAFAEMLKRQWKGFAKAHRGSPAKARSKRAAHRPTKKAAA